MIDLLPMASIKTPRIDKGKMLEKFQRARRKDMIKIRKDFMTNFLEIREECKRNCIDKVYESKEIDRKQVQTRLNDKVLIFRKPLHELPKKVQHDIVQNSTMLKK